jgi:hypothetical protein
MTSTQFPHAPTSYPLSFDTIADSLSLLRTSTPLESSGSALFDQKTEDGCNSQKPPCRINDLQTLVQPSVYNLVNAPRPARFTPFKFRSSRLNFRPSILPSFPFINLRVALPNDRFASPCIFITLRIALFATPFFSHSYKLPGVSGGPTLQRHALSPFKILQNFRKLRKRRILHRLYRAHPVPHHISCGRGS